MTLEVLRRWDDVTCLGSTSYQFEEHFPGEV